VRTKNELGKEMDMNEDIFEGKWKQLRGRIQEKWGELTDDELDQIHGKQAVLVGKLQQKYGYTREEARREVNEFLAGIQV
jgi:uncharacterized protein YjbJ (UPF0337 family)